MAVALDAEALVVGEVQAELVELEVGHLAQPGLDPVGGEVLAGDVDVEAAAGAVGGVADDAFGKAAAGADGLEDGPGAVEGAGLVGGR
ncbi:hypothetical protein GCM10020000_31450 [Streptomyces olivoverticillatus]